MSLTGYEHCKAKAGPEDIFLKASALSDRITPCSAGPKGNPYQSVVKAGMGPGIRTLFQLVLEHSCRLCRFNSPSY
jgi:hypothetical protein